LLAERDRWSQMVTAMSGVLNAAGNEG
jgi:hypothetical protein